MAHEKAPTYYQSIKDSIKGIVFIGVPHRGSDIAKLGAFFAKMLQASTASRTTNFELIAVLKKGSKPLMDISNQAIHRLSGLTIYTFYETEKLWGEVVSNDIYSKTIALHESPGCLERLRDTKPS